ncbi:MAG: asparagine synthase (glutamine-hydrolyzing) [Firmicutes bacterium]|nr:asparagine synthase (glutamine-hydrolyzing) [Bacillota bacterium]
MCGITGWVDWDLDLCHEGPTLEAMVGTLAKRGPDAAGIRLSTRAALGHRRLVVVDPQGGSQPMTYRQGERTYTITYNGELYNTPELRRELESRGRVFTTRSDTEVLLVAFVEWGPVCVERLNGIFAFGVWDEGEQSLFLARDRMGVKPLFYARRGNAFLFGSELKALLANPLVQPELDEDGLAEALVMNPARTPGHGVFRGVSELKPGHHLIFNRKGIHIRRYWALESRPHQDDLDATAETVRFILQDSVERQLVSDVPVSVLLSGGIDSSAITALAARVLQRLGQGPVSTFSVDYINNDQHFRPDHFQPNADGPWVRLVSEYLRTAHRYVVIDTPELVEALAPAVRARDHSGMADVDASLYLFFREIKKEATVVLSGECADELFGGYPWFFGNGAPIRVFPWFRMIEQRTSLLKKEFDQRLRPQEYLKERYREALDEVPRLPGDDPVESHSREIFYMTITRFMPTLLDRKDRMSMAAGVEARVPFCDHRLVEYVWNIPWSMKTCDGREKGILRRALSGALPDGVLERRKSPYPKTHNPAYLSAVRDRIIQILDDRSSPLLSLVDEAAVRRFALADAAAMNLPWFGQLMTGPQLLAHMVQLDTWLREYRVIIP